MWKSNGGGSLSSAQASTVQQTPLASALAASTLSPSSGNAGSSEFIPAQTTGRAMSFGGGTNIGKADATHSRAASAPNAVTAAISWGNTNVDFNANGSWSGGTAPGISDVGVFSSATVTAQPNVTANKSVSGLSFTTGGWNLTSSSTSIKLSLLSTVGTAGSAAVTTSHSSGTVTIGAPIVLGAASGTQTIQTTANGNLTIDGVISSTNNVTLALSVFGSSTLRLNGQNTYTNATTISGSSITSATTLAIGNDSAFSNTAVTLSSGITLTAVGGARNLSNAFTWSSQGTIGGSNDLTFSGSFTGSGSNTRQFTVNNTGLTTLSGNVFLAADNTTARGLQILGTGDVTVSGVIANNNFGNTLASNLTINSSGTVSLLNANNYSGYYHVDCWNTGVGKQSRLRK